MNEPYRLPRVLASLMAVQSLTGLIFPTQYRDPDWIRTAWFANDWVTAVVAVPLLFLGLMLAASGSASGTLLWLGVVCYAVYNYSYYLFGAALNASFLVYVAALVIAVTTLILTLPYLAATETSATIRGSRSTRTVGGVFAVTGIGLGFVWASMALAHVFAGWATPVPPEAFKLVAALDLSIMVPPLTAGGIMLWRSQPWGYIVAPLAGIQSSLYSLVLSAGSFVAVKRGLTPAPGEVPVWATLAVVMTVMTILLLRGIRDERG